MKNNWPTKKLGEIAEVGAGNSAPQDKKYFLNGIISFFRTADVGKVHLSTDLSDTGDFLNKEAVEELGLKVWPKNTILFPKSGASTFLNHRVMIGANGVVSSHLATIFTENDFLQKYIFYFLITIDAKRLTANQSYPSLRISDLQNLKVPLPPLAIQKQIVERLDKIAEAQKLNDALIQKSNELFQSLLYKELNPAGKDWGLEKLEKIIIDTTNGFASRPVPDGIGQLRPNNIDSNGYLNLSSIKFVPKSYRNIKNYFLKGGDILFNNTNSVELVGKTAFIDRDYDYVFSNHMTRIRIDEKMAESQFFAIILQHLYSLGRFRFLCTPWVNQAAVNTTALKRLKILLPPLETQKQIVAKLSAVQDYKTQLLAQKSKLKELFDTILAKSMRN